MAFEMYMGMALQQVRVENSFKIVYFNLKIASYF